MLAPSFLRDRGHVGVEGGGTSRSAVCDERDFAGPALGNYCAERRATRERFKRGCGTSLAPAGPAACGGLLIYETLLVPWLSSPTIHTPCPYLLLHGRTPQPPPLFSGIFIITIAALPV